MARMVNEKAWLTKAYADVRSAVTNDYMGDGASSAIWKLAEQSMQFLLQSSAPIDLVSKVSGKEYFTFARENVLARPANAEFFVTDIQELESYFEAWYQEDDLTPEEFARFTYTAALAPCLAMELFDRNNKKGPATYFEWFIGHFFSKAIGSIPEKRIKLPVHGRDVSLTMDFLFDDTGRHQKIHMPVKMSTRERVVQAWSHQRLLDAAFGEDTYQCIMVCFSETKLDSRNREVVEIAVPNQWLAYQSLLARMDRIYYFDLPNQYLALTQSFPDVITIKEFQEFFEEKDSVIPGLDLP